MLLRRLLPLAAVGLLAASPRLAVAQDADGDGTLDAGDVFPCDATAVAEAFAPGQGVHALMLFEDTWPSAGDLDFNDVVLTYNYAFKLDASGQVTTLQLTLNPLALGGVYTNGLGLHLPVSAGAVQSATLQVGAGAPQPLTASGSDAEATFTLAPDLRALFGGAQDQLNSIASLPAVAGTPIVVEVTLSGGGLTPGAAPYDVFIFRTLDPAHQVHRPEYPGTASMNAARFNTVDDASTPSRHFVDTHGLPFALVLPTLADYPQEAVAISTLYPNIVTFAASGGAQAQDFYVSSVNTAVAYRVSGAPTPVFLTADHYTGDRTCIPVPRSSCLAILQAGAAQGDGVYMLDPCGTGIARPFYCDMSTAGGGWTLAGRQQASAASQMGFVDRGTPGTVPWSSALNCLVYSEVMVFNVNLAQSFQQTYGTQTWNFTQETNIAVGPAGKAFKHGYYGPSAAMGCVNYSYGGGVYAAYACDSDGQRSAQGHLTAYAGEYCAGGRLDNTWAWSNATTCSMRGQQYVWGYGIR
jgi:LruC domain-containing protein